MDCWLFFLKVERYQGLICCFAKAKFSVQNCWNLYPMVSLASLDQIYIEITG